MKKNTSQKKRYKGKERKEFHIRRLLYLAGPMSGAVYLSVLEQAFGTGNKKLLAPVQKLSTSKLTHSSL
jgi:hypothetical protein